MQEKPKKKRGCAPLLVVLVLVVALAAVAAVTVLGEVKGGAPGADVTVSVAQGSGVASISKQLADAGVIRFPQVFRLYVKQSGKASQLQYGDFTLHKGMGYDALIDALSQYAAADTVTLTFPEGTPALGIARPWRTPGCVRPRSSWPAQTGRTEAISPSTTSGPGFRTTRTGL